ncbi:hypothetical protein ACKGJN_16440, partial [Gillisia sp. Q332]|uniref:hypothetical protein n=1 Tax=Gillisia xinjiangensis TaxID=3384765 RepID=UPI003918911E
MPPRWHPSLSSGTRNLSMTQDIRTLITPEGLARFEQELKKLQEERHEVCAIVSWAAGNGDRSENGD